MIVKQWKDVVSIISGKNQKDVVNPNGKYPIYGSGGIIGYADSYLCNAGTTIVGRKGTINNPIFVEEPFWNIDTAFGVVPGDQLIPKYLYYFCLHFNFMPLDKSTGRPSLAKSDLLKIEMPVPDLGRQEQIVSQIEESLSQLDSAVETLKKTKQQLEVYRQAVLKEAFSSFDEYTTIRKSTTIVTSGSRGWAKYYSAAGAAFIRIGNLNRNDISICFDDLKFVDIPKNAEGMRSHLEPLDILISITADLGSIGLVPSDIDEAYINQHIAMVRLNNKKQSEFITWYLRSDLGQKELLKNKRGAGKLGLGLDDIRDSKIPVVDDETANAVVSQIEEKLTLCSSIEKTIDQSLQQAEALRQSILKKAFSYE